MDSVLGHSNDSGKSTTGNRNRRRMEEFRRRKGKEVQAEFHANIMKQYSLDTILKDFLEEPSESVVPVNITTRGIGLLLQDHWTHLESQNIVADENRQVTIGTAYRLSLGQMQAKISSCSPSKTFPPEDADQYDTERIPLEELQHLKEFDTNLGLVASAINQLGNVEASGCHYFPVLTEPPLSEVSMEVDDGAENSIYLIPDPFNVNYTNLRATVDSLSNRRVPQDLRHYFRRNNPLPGAIWNAEHILQNPEFFVPDDYNADVLAADIVRYRGFLSLVANKNRSWVQEVTMGSIGSPSMLTSTKAIDGKIRLETDRPSIKIVEPARTEFYEFYAPRSNMTSMLGALYLLGEFPPHRTRFLGTGENPDLYDRYSLRTPRTGQKSFGVNRRALVMKALSFRRR